MHAILLLPVNLGKKKSDRKEILIIKKILSQIVDEGDTWLSFRKIPNNRQNLW